MDALRHVFGKSWSSDARLDGKTAILTGADTGIGRETARELAKRGARVILACQDILMAELSAREIIRDIREVNVIPMQLDLTDTESICEFAEQAYNSESSLHFLINNAGVTVCPYSTTADGYEMQFGVNHLGHFFLTFLLLELLKHSAPSRVINLTSSAHKMGRIHFDDLNCEMNYHPVKAYVQSKLATILFTQELAKRLDGEGTGVTVYAVDSGIVNTDMTRHMNDTIQLLARAFSFLISAPAKGASTILYCALTPDLKSGGYYSNCTQATCSRAASDDRSARILWMISCEMLGIRWR